jgi:hypothetical protein
MYAAAVAGFADTSTVNVLIKPFDIDKPAVAG